MYRNLKFLHMTDLFFTGLARGPVTNMRYGNIGCDMGVILGVTSVVMWQ